MSEKSTGVKESRGNFKKRLVIGLSVFAIIVLSNYLSFNIGRDLELDKSQVRLFEHLYTFIGLPIVFYYAFGRFWASFAFCLSLAFAWEFGQYLCLRGYFQFDQFAVDLLGMAIATLLYKKIILKTKLLRL